MQGVRFSHLCHSETAISEVLEIICFCSQIKTESVLLIIKPEQEIVTDPKKLGVRGGGSNYERQSNDRPVSSTQKGHFQRKQYNNIAGVFEKYMTD